MEQVGKERYYYIVTIELWISWLFWDILLQKCIRGEEVRLESESMGDFNERIIKEAIQKVNDNFLTEKNSVITFFYKEKID